MRRVKNKKILKKIVLFLFCFICYQFVLFDFWILFLNVSLQSTFVKFSKTDFALFLHSKHFIILFESIWNSISSFFYLFFFKKKSVNCSIDNFEFSISKNFWFFYFNFIEKFRSKFVEFWFFWKLSNSEIFIHFNWHWICFFILKTETCFSFFTSVLYVFIFIIFFHVRFKIHNESIIWIHFYVLWMLFKKKTIFVIRWFRKLKHKLIFFKQNETVSSKRFMNSVNLFLIDDVADWAEINMNAVCFLKENDFTKKTVFAFKILFQERFSVKIMKSSIINFHIELEKFRQKTNESINAYYKRMLNFMSRVAVRNWFVVERLFFLKKATLEKITKTFVKKLHDDDVKKKIIRELIIFDRSLRELFVIAKNADQFKKKMKKIMKKKIDLWN